MKKLHLKTKPAADAGNASEKKKSGGLINNNKLMMLLSLIVAFGIWIWVAIEKSPVVEVTISSVPVQIDMENSVPAQLNLQMFGQTEYYVDVTVSAKRFVASTLTASDISVTAQTNYVDSAGTKSLQLRATAANSKDFEITGLSQNYIDVYFDTYKEAEFAIEPRIVAPDEGSVIEGCTLGDPVFSRSTVVVSGPATEVNTVTGVVAEVVLDAPLSATTTLQPELRLQTDANETLSNVQINAGDSEVTMTIPVLKTVVLPTTVTFRNTPAGYLNDDIPFTVSPSSVEASIPIEQVDVVTAISVGTLDFSELDIGYNRFVFEAADITDYIVTDNTTRFRVTVDMRGSTSASFTVPENNVSIIAQKEGFASTVVPASIENVRVIGTPEEIAALTNDMLYVELDLSDYDIQVGEQTVQVNVIVRGNTKAWASGTYTVRIQSAQSAESTTAQSG